ncbi:class II fructose-bisphosphate aldolase [Candidatus Uhrbacteria bacterium]|nr:class II fructose-bisphosphate aldolase [Candidatus Uhrbacteria bacterium]
MLVTLKEILLDAQKKKYAVPAFNVDNLEMVQAVAEAAHEARARVIIATSESSLAYAGFQNLRALVYLAAERDGILALHLDHGKTMRTIKECIEGGWTSVMFDGSTLPYKENVAKTKQVVAWARKRNVSVEAEIGALRTDEDLTKEGTREALFTDPDQAVRFVKETGIDALAISIGTEHGPFKSVGKTKLDFKRLAEIRKRVSIPLVLHGASGVPKKILTIVHNQCDVLHDCVRLQGARGVSDAAIRKAISLGIRKINIGTDMRLAFTAGLRRALLEHITVSDERELLKEARELVKEVAMQKIRLFHNP